MDINEKRQFEKDMVTEMIALYCRKKHGHKKEMCSECQKLADYACQRSDKCPFMKTKTFCSNCKVHCYKPEMRAKIKDVMRFSGPRMIFVHPYSTIRHVVCTIKEKKQLEKEEKEIDHV
ncbi:MAG: nitrous oxide-stimulated promoter family protein [Faecalibacterium sp.]|nr:nitrous oxide-stimulated promoter family protein [Ruminococcus sp.]MCM1391153.1 nitrous oxide-stimulated promoter family protein [Ruminococcus sp.]MCM1486573.1 nitrous oxide-stimulated promoter family protein [Faecalibacterium sp.]